MLKVKIYVSSHHFGVGCERLFHRLSSKFVSSLIKDEIRSDPSFKASNLKKFFKSRYRINVKYYQAYNGREKAYEDIFGEDAMSYSHLVWYVDAIPNTNPRSWIDFQVQMDETESNEDSSTDLEVEAPSNKFVRLFIAFEACIHGYRYLRPMIYVDVTFLTGIFRGCLMAASAINAENGFFPLAMDLVPAEDNDNWE
ncbi:uncharacterized protein LOC113332979 [Papaver somniferum]|uniref:uncharacterized protein LOC113332979 n=1 Tax=Papaver somniferum TaxID=3469 RepID=UPI000E6FCC93|nr:uncharacterized protein LOC113332979 [Papaver somniferum]